MAAATEPPASTRLPTTATPSHNNNNNNNNNNSNNLRSTTTDGPTLVSSAFGQTTATATAKNSKLPVASKKGSGGSSSSGKGSKSSSNDQDEDKVKCSYSNDQNGRHDDTQQCTSSCQGGITRRVAVNCLVPDLSFPAAFVEDNDLSFQQSSTSNVCPNVVAYCKAQDSNLQNKVYAASFCNPMRTRCASGPVSCNQAYSICSSSRATWCAKFLNSLCLRPTPAPTKKTSGGLIPPSISPRPSMSPRPTNIPTVTTEPSSRPTVSKLECGKTLNEWIEFINAIYPTCALATVKSQADLNYYASQNTQSSPLLVGMVKDSDSSAYQCQLERNAASESDMQDYACLPYCYEGWQNVADNSYVEADPHYWAEGQPDGQGQGSGSIATVAGLKGDGSPLLYDESEVTTFDYAMMECCLDLGEQQLCQSDPTGAPSAMAIL
ncbi:hypothetical protein ACA910_000673 [Epithemia clementina (nom. ined.)]